jgi:hypothetical protein
MNASSESGLCALTISRGEDEGIASGDLPVYTTEPDCHEGLNENEKGAVTLSQQTRKTSEAVIQIALSALRQNDVALLHPIT